MKINMIFNLEDEMDKKSFEDATANLRLGYKYRQLIEEFSEYLRKRLKYEELSDKEFATIEAIKEEFYRIRAEVMD